MKMKKGLMMVVLLLALSSVMAAMSYSSAKVTNAMTGSVKSTEDSLVSLRLTNTPHDAAKIVEGDLILDFHNYRGGNKFGMQKNSEYIWNDLFLIKNNSENPVNLTITTEKHLNRGHNIFVKTGDSDWKRISGNDVAEFNGWDVASQRNVSIKIVLDDNARMLEFTPNLIVNSSDAR
ncbi:hypothetical protein [Sporosarcina sp. FA9]|uniref:hypothetical protein n=1 Tax=Sporosarcina sp. FA9 TaxID=3413030 RepID=UPI003F65F2BE